MKRAPAVPMNGTFMNSPPHLVGRSAPPTGGAGGGRDFGEVLCCLRAEVALVKLRHSLERVDLLDRLVVAGADDAREAQRGNARLAAPKPERSERHLPDD